MELTEAEGEEYNRRKKELQIIDINNLPEDLQFVTDEEFIDIIEHYQELEEKDKTSFNKLLSERFGPTILSPSYKYKKELAPHTNP